jgi:4-diphosphocytidyl-2-C-methyl-D-erythritol kinase
MPTTLPSYGKINLGLCIGARRADGFHELATVYQTIALHDTIKVITARGSGIEIRCKDERVPADHSNTCWRMAERVLRAARTRAKVTIEITKKLPVQGGLGAASSNAVVTMLALERELKLELAPAERLRLAAEVGSDLPLFLVGGTVLGCGRGEQVFALEDLPALECVLVAPPVGVSTPEAFARWDNFAADKAAELTLAAASDRISEFSRSVYAWLSGSWKLPQSTGVPGSRKGGGDRAEAVLLDLVRTGIENDFERVVFSQYPELRDVKRALEREGARYAALSGSGAALFGLFAAGGEAQQAAQRLQAAGWDARATQTLTRAEYWQQLGTGH